MADIRSTLRARLRERMTARDTAAVKAIRNALAAVENAEAQPLDGWSPTEVHLAAPSTAEVERRLVTEEEARSIVAAEVAELDAAAHRYRSLGDPDRAATVEAQAAVLAAALAEP